jgi:glycerol-3-phosphate acyltransferase PlsY
VSYVAALVGGYLAGSIPTGYWLVRLVRGIDIRRIGSRSIGATNVWRVMGWKVGVPTIVIDVLKGLVPTLVASLLVNDVAGVLAGAGAMLGHARPIFLKFEKGGKAGRDDRGRDPRARAARRALRARGVGRDVRRRALRVGRLDGGRGLAARVRLRARRVVAGEDRDAGRRGRIVFLHRENIRRLFAHKEPRVQLAAMFKR